MTDDSQIYDSTYGWNTIRFGVNGSFDIISVPSMCYPNTGETILYDKNGVILSCDMVNNQWLDFTIVNNNSYTVGLSMTLSTDEFRALSPTSGYEEGFVNSSTRPNLVGGLTYQTYIVFASTGNASQGWISSQTVEKEHIGYTWTLYTLAAKNQLNSQITSTNVEMKASYGFVDNMPSRVYWTFRLKAKLASTQITRSINAVPTLYPYEPVIQVEDVTFDSVGGFLNQSVGSFFNFPLMPGITIGGIISVLLAVLVVIVFLKMFAGG